jgi:hypothetical protein
MTTELAAQRMAAITGLDPNNLAKREALGVGAPGGRAHVVGHGRARQRDRPARESASRTMIFLTGGDHDPHARRGFISPMNFHC